MAVRARELIKQFPSLIELVAGSDETKALAISAPEKASPESLVFVHSEKLLEGAMKSSATLVVVSPPLVEKAQSLGLGSKTLLTSKNLQLAMAKSAKAFFPVLTNKQAFDGHQIHPSAIISETAEIGKGVLIGPLAVIGAHTKIGDGCIIGGSTHIEAQVEIGEDSHIHPQVFIGHSTLIGKNVEIHPQSSIGTEGYGYAHDEQANHYRITHYGRVVIEDNVHIGAGFCVDRGTFGDTLIGEGTKIDNHGHIGHNGRIGKRCLLTGGFMSAGSAKLGDRNITGGRTTIGGHLEVADDVHIAALSGVQSSIKKSGKYGGYPAQPLSQALKTYSTLAHLPQMRKNLARLMKKVGLTSDDA